MSGAQSVTITLPAGANAFYFYAEPQQFENFTMTATTSDGTTSGPISVAGYAGAKYFGFYTTGTAPLASITGRVTRSTSRCRGEPPTTPSPPGRLPAQRHGVRAERRHP
ncbi:MAG TPA: hypothetical protein VHZ03_49160 [Trebonia sp.]|nr:hypothetical protein [Trebonia sp.]